MWTFVILFTELHRREMNYGMDLVNVVFVNHSEASIFSGGKSLIFMRKPLEDNFFTRGECNNKCSRFPDATFSGLFLLETRASYLQNIN